VQQITRQWTAQDAEALALEFLARVWGPAHELDAIDELMRARHQVCL